MYFSFSIRCTWCCAFHIFIVNIIHIRQGVLNDDFALKLTSMIHYFYHRFFSNRFNEVICSWIYIVISLRLQDHDHPGCYREQVDSSHTYWNLLFRCILCENVVNRIEHHQQRMQFSCQNICVCICILIFRSGLIA
jgi:hypothetical protein